ncbi:MFS transporter [Amycolatopsis nigrescens]|uniref:MFS transporter n=1 Tax=Amycolatopsis nigrescens TaxID=381445 RepID=UPI00058CB13A|nr:MFS transporter [Amycolatopsis nigrescens]
MRRGTTARPLVVVALVAFVTTLDNNIVAAAAPSIGRELGLGLAGLQGITLGYMLPFAGLLLVAGSLIDRWGQHRTLVAGLLVFGAGAILGGCARNAELLIFARVLQGAAAAFAVPATLSLLRTELDERRRAVGAAIWTAALAVALALGPVAGGLLSEQLHWSWIFFSNVPFAVVALFLVPPGSGERTRGPAPDLAGTLAATVAMVCCTLALLATGTGGGWTAPVALGATGVLAAIAFLLLERRSANPLLPKALLRERVFTGGLLVQLLWGLGVSGVFFFTPLMHQDSLGLGPTAAGLPLILVAVALVLATPFVAPAVARFGPRRTVAAGLLTVGVGLFAVAVVNQQPDLVPRFPGLLLIGAGSAFTVPLTSHSLEVVPERLSGIASGLLTASRELSSALGVAVIGAVLAAWRAMSTASGAADGPALASGYAAGLVTAGALQVLAALLALAVFSPARSPGAAR